jgi:hypothetical protein
MTSDDLKKVQTLLKEKYKASPGEALITLKASGSALSRC